MRGFWDRVASGDPGECWEWTGATSHGYGYLRINGKKVGAHRVAYEAHHGAIPDGLFVCHTCDNPPCCNPAHLFTGTNADNAADMRSKGRHSPPPVRVGGAVNTARLDPARVVEIRQLAAQGVNQSELSRRFGVSRRAVQMVIGRLSWRHVEEVAP